MSACGTQKYLEAPRFGGGFSFVFPFCAEEHPHPKPNPKIWFLEKRKVNTIEIKRSHLSPRLNYFKLCHSGASGSQWVGNVDCLWSSFIAQQTPSVQSMGWFTNPTQQQQSSPPELLNPNSYDASNSSPSAVRSLTVLPSFGAVFIGCQAVMSLSFRR